MLPQSRMRPEPPFPYSDGNTTMKPHVEHFLTRYHEMGRDNLIRIPALCNYLEEAAGVHATLLGVGFERMSADGLTWVLAKMRLQLNRRPGPGEQVVVETWPVAIERLQFRRDFILYDEDRNILATAVTQWVVMGIASRKVERFPVHIVELKPENPALAQESGDIRIPVVSGGSPGPVFPVRLADIDQNQHVNNGRYVDFALEAAHVAGMNDTPSQIELLFRAEGLRGDVIACLSAADQGNPRSLIHSLCRQSDGQELVRARTRHE